MDRPETISLLRHAHDEVITLRRRIAELDAQGPRLRHDCCNGAAQCPRGRRVCWR
jgi:hypothetical protein